MDKLEQLLHMAEHPGQYTDEQIDQMLADDDMRAYYELMVSARTGFALRKTAPAATPRQSPLWRHIAAAVAVMLAVSGIALATYMINRHETRGEAPAGTHQLQPSATSRHEVPTGTQQEPRLVLFEDAELQTILQQVALFYHKDVVFSNDSTRHIRLYIRWNQAESANEMIERLNNFEKVNIRMEGNNIISE